MDKESNQNFIKAGKIAAEVVSFARTIVKKDMPLLEIAEKIEGKIVELGGKPAFPVNLSINEIAAHATPSYDSTDKAYGLLKVDIGVHIDGCIADTAFSVDLENSAENKKLIIAAESALGRAVSIFGNGVSLKEIGRTIEDEIKSHKCIPVANLSGHSIEQYDVHAGITIPNIANNSDEKIGEGVFAVEPFTTNGMGKVRDGASSGIYHLIRDGNVRDNASREVLAFIAEEYQTLPFCSRWIYNKFGTRGLLALRFIRQAGLLYEFSQLVEVSGGVVAQAEHSFLVEGKEVKVITK